jgi:DNA-binding NtrC family response regulator
MTRPSRVSDERPISSERELAGAEVLVVDADPAVQQGITLLFAPERLPVTVLSDQAKALELVGTKLFGVIIVDLDTPAPGAGIAFVKKVRERSPTSLVLLLVARKSFDSAVAAFRAGAHDVILKAPDQVPYLSSRIRDAAGDWVTRRGSSALLVDVRESLEELVKRFMAAERRASELEDRLTGRQATRTDLDDEVRVLFVDTDDRLYRSLLRSGKPFQFSIVPTGGAALDQITKGSYQIVLVGPSLPDLPSSMVTRTMKTQSPETIVIAYEPNGRLDIVETSRFIPIVEKFTAASQLSERLAELAEARRQALRERRYVQGFRDRHHELLRRLSDLGKRIERALEDGKDTFTFKE